MLAITTLQLILSGITLSLYTFYWLWTKNYSYWKDRNVPGPDPNKLYGNTPSFLNKKSSYCLEMEKLYNDYKKKTPLVGYYAARTPHLLATDRHTVKNILVKDFANFSDNEASNMMDRESDPIVSRNPFFQKRDDWKLTRQELSPAFSKNRIRSYFPIMKDVNRKLTNFVDDSIAKSPVLDIDKVGERYTTELASDIIFGVQANALSSDGKDCEVMNRARKFIIDFSKITDFFVQTGFLPALKRFFRYRMMEIRERNFFKGMLRESASQRDDDHKRDDYMQYLVDLKQKGRSDTELTSHAMAFFVDGYDTCSLAVANVLDDLARHPRVQERLREEIFEMLDAKKGKSPEYEDITKLPYLRAVIQESLRLRPPFSTLIRQCTKDYTLVHPDHKNPIKIAKGTPVMIHIAAMNKDPDNWEDPLTFKPERFIGADVRELAKEGRLMTFGGGPRQCLGMRYGLVQSQMFVFEIISNYRLTPAVSDQQIVPSASHFFGYPSKPIILRGEKINRNLRK